MYRDSSDRRNVTSIQSSRTVYSIWFCYIDRLSQGRVRGAFTVLAKIVSTCLRGGGYRRWRAEGGDQHPVQWT